MAVASRDDAVEDTMFGPNFIRTPKVPGAIDAIAALAEHWDIFIVSKAGPKVEARTRVWLNAHNFPNRTGVQETDWYFCRERRDKAQIARRLELTAFVDDRRDVLESLVLPIRIAFGVQNQPQSFAARSLFHAPSWAEATDILLRTAEHP